MYLTIKGTFVHAFLLLADKGENYTHQFEGIAGRERKGVIEAGENKPGHAPGTYPVKTVKAGLTCCTLSRCVF
ncbi:MAG: hypothetical protein D3906_06250 [Candidatus Electrothrix sp. AUS1_2]|nr:hypothetical protein [Candidatus Electrothrix sp. AUS1_2]